MIINKYWEPKKTYKSRRHNKFYAGKLTKRNQKKSDKEKSVFLIVCFLMLLINLFINTENTIRISSDEAVHASSIATSYLAEGVDNSLSVDEIDFSRDEVINEIVKQSRNFGLDENMMLALARCENDTFDPTRKNPTSTATGIYQYVVGTWNETQSAKNGIERTDYKANIKEAMIDVSNGESWRWRDCGIIIRAKGFNF